MNDLVTVVIPVYNSQATIEQSVESVREQDYSNLEIIAVNDGSTDDSLDILNNFSEIDPRFHVIDIRNGGVSNARNVGIRKANGKWITFLDADDTLAPDFLYSILSEQEKTSADVIVSAVELFMDERHLVQKLNFSRNCLLKEKSGIETLARATITGEFGGESRSNMALLGYCHGKLYRTAIVKRHRFNAQVIMREDALFNLQVFLDSQCIYLTKISGYKYIIGRSQATVKYNPKMDNSIRVFLNEVGMVFANQEFSKESFFKCGVFTYMSWLKLTVVNQKKARMSSKYRQIAKSTYDPFWVQMFNGVNTNSLPKSYLFLAQLFKKHFGVSILLLGLADNLILQLKTARIA